MKKLSLKDLKSSPLNALDRNQMKNVFGGNSMEDTEEIDGGGYRPCWVKCNSGSQYNIPNCDKAPDGICHSTGWSICTCLY